MLKKALCLLLSLLLLPAAHAFALPDGANLIDGGSFETPSQDAALWSGGTIDANAACLGEYGIQVLNPYGEVDKNGNCAHQLDYALTIALSQGRVYTISAYVLNPFAESAQSPSGRASLASGSLNLTFNVRGVSCEWRYVSDTFIAPKSGQYSLSLILGGGDSAFGVFADEVRVFEKDTVPTSLSLNGAGKVYVPDIGERVYYYRPIMYDENKTEIGIFSASVRPVSALPQGVSFDNAKFALTVSANAPVGASFVLECSPPAGVSLAQISLTVTLSNNLLIYGSFDDESDLDFWDSTAITGRVAQDGGYLALFTDADSPYGSCASLSPAYPVLLEAGAMYVFRARIRSDEAYPSSSIYAKNVAVSDEGRVTLNITDIGGGRWSDAVTAFCPYKSGVYEIDINLCAQTDRPIYIDDISLSEEAPEATSLSIQAPGNIAVCETEYFLPFSVTVRDQMGEMLPFETAEMFLSPEIDGVTLDAQNSVIAVSPGAKKGDYTLRAVSESNPDISGSYTFTVSDDYIGDGGFEMKSANEWWAAIPPAQLKIYDAPGGKMAMVYNEAGFCVALNNSYMKLSGGQTYAFSARLAPAVKDAPFSVTVFLNTISGQDDLPLCQATVADDTLVSYLVPIEKDAIGRLLLYFEPLGDAPLAAVMDDVSLSRAIVQALDVHIEGNAYKGSKIKGAYTYYNNLADDPQHDSSITRWYIGGSADGPFEPIMLATGDTLLLTDQMVGQYVLFEVIPACGKTGISGEAVRSATRFVRASGTGNENAADHEGGSVYIPISGGNAALVPAALPAKGETSFRDITGHWAYNEITALAAAGIVNGRSRTAFAPEETVTRAEFSAMLIRAFSLLPSAYQGGFTDVSASDWFAGTVETAVGQGFAVGITKNDFAPASPIDREQIAMMAVRAYYKADGAAPLDLDLKFTDLADISPWALIGVKDAYNLGIVMGFNDGSFAPKKTATRAEAAVMIARMLKKLS